jgi:hypothetical protein
VSRQRRADRDDVRVAAGLHPARGGKKDAFIYFGDRWRPQNAIDGRYVWLPIEFRYGVPTIAWHETWDLGVFDAKLPK